MLDLLKHLVFLSHNLDRWREVNGHHKVVALLTCHWALNWHYRKQWCSKRGWCGCWCWCWGSERTLSVGANADGCNKFWFVACGFAGVGVVLLVGVCLFLFACLTGVCYRILAEGILLQTFQVECFVLCLAAVALLLAGDLNNMVRSLALYSFCFSDISLGDQAESQWRVEKKEPGWRSSWRLEATLAWLRVLGLKEEIGALIYNRDRTSRPVILCRWIDYSKPISRRRNRESQGYIPLIWKEWPIMSGRTSSIFTGWEGWYLGLRWDDGDVNDAWSMT